MGLARLDEAPVSTTLVKRRLPTLEEKKRGADVVFIRRDKEGRKYEILAYFHREYGSWFQWGVDTKVLGDNVRDIDRWADRKREKFALGA